MSAVQPTSPVALLVADIHLSLRAPIWRTAEPDWLEAMKRPLFELKTLAETLDVPVICAGDIFDHWYGAHQSSELINFAIEHLPTMYAIPGQHDLSNHNLSEIKKSAFWTLVQANKIKMIPTEGCVLETGDEVYGFPYGILVTPPLPTNNKVKRLRIAVAHQYVWTQGCSFPNAPEEKKISNIQKAVFSYDVVVFGDNHKHFQIKMQDTTFYNCGGFMRRKSDEINYAPKIGILHSDGSVESVCLDISEDKQLRVQDISTAPKGDIINMNEFIEELERLGHSGLDFLEAIKQYNETNNVNKGVRTILCNAMQSIK